MYKDSVKIYSQSGSRIQTALTNHEDKILEETRFEPENYQTQSSNKKADLLIVVLPLLYPEDVRVRSKSNGMRYSQKC